MRRRTGSGGVLLVLLAACTAPRGQEPCDWEALGLPEPGSEEAEESDEAERGVPAYARAARVLVARGEAEEARRVLTAGLDLDPGDVELLALRSEVLSDAGYRRAAERDLLRALDRAPSETDLWRRLGEVRLELDLPASACQALRRCDTAGGEDVRGAVLLAEATRRCGQTAKAWGLYADTLGNGADTDAAVLVDAASLFLDPTVQSRFPDARARAYAWVNLAIVRSPEVGRAHRVRGALLADEGKTDNAIASYRRALELEPEDAEAAAELALLLAERGDRLPAAALAGTALGAMAPDAGRDPERRRELLRLLAAAPAASPR